MNWNDKEYFDERLDEINYKIDQIKDKLGIENDDEDDNDDTDSNDDDYDDDDDKEETEEREELEEDEPIL